MTASMAQTNTKSNCWNFDTEKISEIAKGFSNDVGQWKVLADDSAPSKGNVLAQLAKSEKTAYNVTFIIDTQYKNVDLSVKLKAIAGEIDQGGGVVWRAKDAQNYYVCRYNPLEKNFRVYKVVGGKRDELGSADVSDVKGWHTIRVVMNGDRIECHLDGKKLLEVSDSTITVAGRIGLWTKADGQTYFDDLTATGE
ncbi:MAG: family 16 glycoside hydrolase [Planctomycetota bacterium]